jgi:hypothetical protein
MRFFILLPFVAALCVAGQTPPLPKDGSPVDVLGFRWFQDRLPAPQADVQPNVPMRAVIPENKYFQRKAREQLSPGAIDPNEQTIDGRSAAIEKAVQESRTLQAKAVDGYSYRATVKNITGTKTEVIFWEYQFTELANPSNFVRRQFICVAGIKPGENKELQVFSIAGPSDAISAESLAKPSQKLFDEKVVVNRIEYSNGAILQRPDWDYKKLKPAIDHAVKTPWGREMCRAF